MSTVIGASCLTRRMASSLSRVNYSGLWGERAYRRRGEKAQCGCDICHHLIGSPWSPGSVFQAGGLGLPGRLTSGKTLKFMGLSSDTGASLQCYECSVSYPKGVQRGWSSDLALLIEPHCHSLIWTKALHGLAGRGPWLTQRGQGPTAWAVRAI